MLERPVRLKILPYLFLPSSSGISHSGPDITCQISSICLLLLASPHPRILVPLILLESLLLVFGPMLLCILSSSSGSQVLHTSSYFRPLSVACTVQDSLFFSNTRKTTCYYIKKQNRTRGLYPLNSTTAPTSAKARTLILSSKQEGT